MNIEPSFFADSPCPVLSKIVKKVSIVIGITKLDDRKTTTISEAIELSTTNSNAIDLP